MPRWRFSSIIHPLSSTRQWALGQAPGACEKKRGGDQHNIAASLHACLRAFFACSPSLHFYRRLCYAFWIKAVSTLITLLKEYIFCNHGRQSVLVLSHNFQVHYLPPPPSSLSLSLSPSLSLFSMLLPPRFCMWAWERSIFLCPFYFHWYRERFF